MVLCQVERGGLIYAFQAFVAADLGTSEHFF